MAFAEALIGTQACNRRPALASPIWRYRFNIEDFLPSLSCRRMLGKGDECRVTASHKYLTAGRKKIFPECFDLADEPDSPPVSGPISGIGTRDAETGLLPLARLARSQ